MARARRGILMVALAAGLSACVSGPRWARADSHPCLSRVRAQDAALRQDTRRLRFRDNIERVIRAWSRSKTRCPTEARAHAVRGHADALALLAHWSGRADDRAKARSAQARARRLADPIQQIRQEMRAAHPDIVAQLERRRAPQGCCDAVRRIVLDPGHGGRDGGASASGGRREKDINLAIARRLGAELERRYGVKVIFTRTRDRFVSLNERVRIANRRQGDLFVSIHANAHRSASVRGIETYYATRAEPKISQRVARAVQRSLIVKMRKRYRDVRDLGVKRGRFHVLRAARMPALLVETGFITHEREGRRLASARYQREVAEAIAEGVGRLIKRPQHLAQHSALAQVSGSSTAR